MPRRCQRKNSLQSTASPNRNFYAVGLLCAVFCISSRMAIFTCREHPKTRSVEFYRASAGQFLRIQAPFFRLRFKMTKKHNDRETPVTEHFCNGGYDFAFMLFCKACRNGTDYFMASSTATAQATVAPTMGLLPMPIRPIISTCAGTDEEPANCASPCILPIESVRP